MKHLCLFVLLGLSLANAQNLESKPKHKWLYLSIAAVSIASSFDATTSLGQVEQNRFLTQSNGQFGRRSVEIKMGMLGGLFLAEWRLRRNPRAERKFIFTNFAGAGVYAGAGWHNLRGR